MQLRRNSKGTMLIDLLVAMGIVAILTAISIPYLRKYQPNLKLNAAARSLTTDLRYAQQLTVTEQQIYVVFFDIINKQYLIQKAGAATTTVKTVDLDPDLSFKQITGLTNDYVYFNFYGGVSEAGQIILTNTNSLDATVNVKPSGYIQLIE